MNNTKVKKAENNVLDYPLDDETQVKINRLNKEYVDKMNNTKVKEAENKVLDYLLDNWESSDTEVKINYLRLLVENYYREREKCL